MKLYLLLRSIIWTAVLAIVFIAASIASLLIVPNTQAPLAFGAGAITFSILSFLEGGKLRK